MEHFIVTGKEDYETLKKNCRWNWEKKQIKALLVHGSLQPEPGLTSDEAQKESKPVSSNSSILKTSDDHTWSDSTKEGKIVDRANSSEEGSSKDQPSELSELSASMLELKHELDELGLDPEYWLDILAKQGGIKSVQRLNHTGLEDYEFLVTHCRFPWEKGRLKTLLRCDDPVKLDQNNETSPTRCKSLSEVGEPLHFRLDDNQKPVSGGGKGEEKNEKERKVNAGP